MRSSWVAPATDLEAIYWGKGADSARNRVFTEAFTLSMEYGMLNATYESANKISSLMIFDHKIL